MWRDVVSAYPNGILCMCEHILVLILFIRLLQITVYLGKRDFVDHITHVDPIGK